MRSEPDIRLKIRRSALAGYFAYLAGALIAASVWLSLRALGIAPAFATVSAFVVGFVSIWWLRRASQATQATELIFRATGGCWLAPIHAIADSDTAELPELLAYQNYFGLLFLENRAKQSVLLWPDQLEAESARLLRIWVKAQVRRN